MISVVPIGNGMTIKVFGSVMIPIQAIIIIITTGEVSLRASQLFINHLPINLINPPPVLKAGLGAVQEADLEGKYVHL